MATYTAPVTGATSMFELFGYAFFDYGLGTFTGSGFDVTIASSTATGFSIRYQGSGLTWSGSTPSGGTYTSIEALAANGTVSLGTLTGFSADFTAITTDRGTTPNAYSMLDGNDTLNGNASANDLFGGYGGNDTFNGNGGGDTFWVTTRILAPSHIFNGSVGSFDTVHVMLAAWPSIDFVLSTFASIERIVVDGGAAAAIYASQFDSGELSTSLQINDGTGAGQLIIAVDTAVLDMTGFTGTINDLRVNGSDNADSVEGSELSETMAGGLDGDLLVGNGGNDFLSGEAGNDNLGGGAGRDTLLGGAGDDTLDGGDEIDRAYYFDASFGVTVDLSIIGPQAIGAGMGSDTIVNIEEVEGSNFNDSLTGDAVANTLVGQDGDDLLVGGGGNDSLYGGTGNDTYGVEATTDIIFEFAGEGTNDTVRSGNLSLSLASYSNIEDLELTGSAALNLTGNSGINKLTGNTGANMLNGGTDALADTLKGLSGNDTYIINSATDDIVEGSAEGTADRARASVSFTLAAGDYIEFLDTTDAAGTVALNLTGNNLAQTITGNSGANTLNGGTDALADTLVGLGGNDIYIINSATDNITETSTQGTADRAKASVSFTLAAGDYIEFLETTNALLTTAIGLTGNNLAQTITGNAGVNTLNGGVDAVADILIGLGGNDIYIINSATDNITETSTQGTADRAKASVSFTLAAGDYIEFLETANAAGTAAINLTGNSIAQTITGNAGANIINGAGGNDTMAGGLGNDIFVFNTLLASTNVDRITDFNVAADTIRLENTGTGLFNALAGGALGATAFNKGAGFVSAQDSSDRIVYNTTTGDLYYDKDGLGGSAAVKFATIFNKAALTNADFVIV